MGFGAILNKVFTLPALGLRQRYKAGMRNMLQAEQSLEFILDRVQELGQGDKPDQKAAYSALIHMTQRRAAPTGLFAGQDLARAERIGPDPADRRATSTKFGTPI